MCLKIILKVTKSHSFTLFLEDIFFEKPQQVGGGRRKGGQTDQTVLGLGIKFQHKLEL